MTETERPTRGRGGPRVTLRVACDQCARRKKACARSEDGAFCKRCMEFGLPCSTTRVELRPGRPRRGTTRASLRSRGTPPEVSPARESAERYSDGHSSESEEQMEATLLWDSPEPLVHDGDTNAGIPCRTREQEHALVPSVSPELVPPTLGDFDDLAPLPPESTVKLLITRYFRLSDELRTWGVRIICPQPKFERVFPTLKYPLRDLVMYSMLALELQHESPAEKSNAAVIPGLVFSSDGRGGDVFLSRACKLVQTGVATQLAASWELLFGLWNLALACSVNVHVDRSWPQTLWSLTLLTAIKMQMHTDPDLHETLVPEARPRGWLGNMYRMTFWGLCNRVRTFFMLCGTPRLALTEVETVLNFAVMQPTCPRIPHDYPLDTMLSASDLLTRSPKVLVSNLSRVPSYGLAHSSYAGFLSGEIRAFRVRLLAHGQTDPFRPSSPQDTQYFVNEMRTLDELVHILMSSYPVAAQELLYTGKVSVSQELHSDYFVLCDPSADAQAASSRFSTRCVFELLEICTASIILHSPLPFHDVLILPSEPDVDTAGNAVDARHAGAWLASPLGFAKCLESAGYMLNAVTALRESSWKRRGPAVWLTHVIGLYLCAVVHVISYRNLLATASANGTIISADPCGSSGLPTLGSLIPPSRPDALVSGAYHLATSAIEILDQVALVTPVAASYGMAARALLAGGVPLTWECMTDAGARSLMTKIRER